MENQLVTRFYLLDVVRLFFALIVCYVHTNISYGKFNYLAAYLSVVFFFILSGYVLTHQVNKSGMTYRSFFVSRISRIFPLYIFSFISVILLLDINPFSEERILSSVSEFFLIHQLGFTNEAGINGVAWSLSVEFWLNILVLYFIAQYKPVNKALYNAILVSTVFMSIIMTMRISASSGAGSALEANIQPLGLITNIGVIVGYFGLVLGYLLYQAAGASYAVRLNKMPFFASLLEIACLILIIFFFTRNNSTGYGILSVIVFSLFILISRADGGILSKISALPLMREIGNLSYATYLLHTPIRIVLDRFFFPYHATENKTIYVVLLTLIVSVPVYYFFELPVKIFLNKHIKKLIA